MECFSSSVCGNRYGCPTGLQLFQTAKEQLGRGVVAIRENPSDVVVSWRYLSSDPINTSFNVYRNGEKIAEVPHSTGTFYRDTYSGNEKAVYTVKPVINGVETGKLNGNYTLPANAPSGYIDIPLDRPAEGVTPSGQNTPIVLMTHL